MERKHLQQGRPADPARLAQRLAELKRIPDSDDDPLADAEALAALPTADDEVCAELHPTKR